MREDSDGSNLKNLEHTGKSRRIKWRKVEQRENSDRSKQKELNVEKTSFQM